MRRLPTLLTLRLAGIREAAEGEPSTRTRSDARQAACSARSATTRTCRRARRAARTTGWSIRARRAEIAGTSAGRLVRAVAELSAGRRVALGVTGPWTSRDGRSSLIEIALAEKDAALVLNVGTRFFWGSRPSIAELLAYLESGRRRRQGRQPDWAVGHFVGCLGVAARSPGQARDHQRHV